MRNRAPRVARTALRVLFITNLYPPLVVGGAELVVERQAQALRSHGHDVAVLTTTGETALLPRRSESWRSGIRVISMPSPNVYHFVQRPASKHWRVPWALLDAVNPLSAQTVRSVTRHLRPDVVVTSNLWNLSTSVWRAAADAAPVMHILHDGSSICLTGYMLHRDLVPCFGTRPPCAQLVPIRRRQSAAVSLVVAPSRFLLERTVGAGLFAHAEIRQIANPRVLLEPSCSSLAADSEEGRPLRVAFVGQLAPHKGPHVLAEEVRRIRGVELHIIGSGDESLLSPLHDTPDRIFLHGWLPSGPRSDMLRRCDVLALPSLCFENHPGAVVEAHQLGLPVIAFAAGGVPEMVTDGENGVLVPAFNRSAFGAALVQLRDNRELLRALGAAARQRYVRESLESPEKQFVAALESLGPEPPRQCGTSR